MPINGFPVHDCGLMCNWMRVAILLSLVSALTLPLAHAAVVSGGPPDFSGYDDETMGWFTFTLHADQREPRYMRGENRLIIFRFHEDQTATLTFLKVSGRVGTFNEIFQYAVQGSRQRQLNPEELAVVGRAIRSLSVTNSHPPLKRLILVGFPSGKTWITRAFDSDKPPHGLREIYAAFGPEIMPARDRL